MLQDLHDLFLLNPTMTVSFAMAGLSVLGLLGFYLLTRTRKKEKEPDAYEQFLAEEFKMAKQHKEEVVQIPVESPTEIFDEPVIKKPARKKAAKKPTAKKTAKKPAKKAAPKNLP